MSNRVDCPSVLKTIVIFACGLACICQETRAQLSVTPIVRRGDELPDENGVVRFTTSNEEIDINDLNEVYFIGDTDVRSGQGVWRYRNNEFTKFVSAFGEPTPSGIVAVHDDDTSLVLGSRYQGIILDEVLGEQPHDVWRWDPDDGLTPIAFDDIPDMCCADRVQSGFEAGQLERVSDGIRSLF